MPPVLGTLVALQFALSHPDSVEDIENYTGHADGKTSQKSDLHCAGLYRRCCLVRETFYDCMLLLLAPTPVHAL